MPYDQPAEHGREVFDVIAERLVAEIKPKKILVVGYGMAFLVEALRHRGVAGFGLAFSRPAMREVRREIQPYCRVGAAVDCLDDQYDLIVCLDFAEHLAEDEAKEAIARICRSTGDVIFSFAPRTLQESAPGTSRPRAVWVERFAEQRYYLDVDFDARFIDSSAMRFRKASGCPLAGLPTQDALLQSQLTALRHSIAEKDHCIADLSFHLLSAQGTLGWKVLERLRRVRDRLLPSDTGRRNAYGRICQVVKVLLDEGLSTCLRRRAQKIRQAWTHQVLPVEPLARALSHDPHAQYQVWLQRHQLAPHAMAEMGAGVASFAYAPLISVISPVYDPEELWLQRAIESVRAQIYPNWELCLVDDASTKPHVKAILGQFAAADPRIRVKYLLSNEGIAGASNHALGLATGEFVGLLDHDDELTPDALFEVVKRLNADPTLDLLYSDEDKLSPDGRRVEPFFKPDWSPDLLLSTNYICHFSVFRGSLLRAMGGFRAGFDGSQDYDLILRFTERTDKIAHIPKVLYHWRKHPGSAAASEDAKPFAYEAGRRALEAAMQRRGLEGWVEQPWPGRYRVRSRARSTPLVSIMIPTGDRWQLLQQCLRSVEEKTDYSRYEIIILDNHSTEPETLQYLDSIAGKWRVYRYPGPFNFSAINNFGAVQAKGGYLVFLNNDTQVIQSDWLTAMLEHAQRPNVGAVGAKLVYPDGRIQHAGVVLGVGGVASHAFQDLPESSPSYFGFADLVRNCSAVTSACMLVSRMLFEQVGGFDERFRVAFHEVDFCLRLRQRGYLIVYTPLALLFHDESATRGQLPRPEDEALCWQLWGDQIRAGDPYYNPHLTLSRSDWSLSL